MKKIFAFIVLLSILVVTNSAFALTKTTFTTTNFTTLEHGIDYTWELSWMDWANNLKNSEYIVSANISIANLNNSNEPENDSLNILLLNNPYQGWPTEEYLTTYNDDNGSWWWWWWFNNPSENFSYDLNAEDIKALTTYLSDGYFGLGFDPNCHYSDTKITFTIVTDKIPVVQTPEPASMFLFGLGLLGLAAFRKRMKK